MLESDENFSQRVISGGFWIFTLRMVNQAFYYIRLIILARFLAPYDFGLMGIALLTLSMVETLSQTGFKSALIQKKEDIKSYLDASWTILILRGLILFILFLTIAPYSAILFDAPEAATIIQVMGLLFLLEGFRNIGIIYFMKELKFKKQFIYEFSGVLADFIVSITSVLIVRSVWALVFGLLARNLMWCITSYIIHPYRPRFTLKLGKAKELFGFGKWIFLSSVILFLTNSSDSFLVGIIFGAASLGIYQMALKISNMPAKESVYVISQVTFPAYSKLQDDKSNIKEGYLRVLQVTAFFSFPLAGLIFVLAPEFTTLFLGESWIFIIPIMQILIFMGLIRSIGATTDPVFQGIGKPAIATKLQLFQLILIITLIYPLSIEYGVVGTSLAMVISALIATFVGSWIVIKIVQCGRWKFCKMIVFPLINTIIMVSLIFILKIYWVQSVGILEFLFIGGIGMLAYIGIAYLFENFYSYKIFREGWIWLREKIL